MNSHSYMLFSQFMLWLGAQRSKETVTSYKYGLSGFRKFIGERDVRSLELHDLTLYISTLESRGLRSATRATYVTALRTFWKWMYRQKMVPFSDELIPVPQIISKEPHPYLLEDEYRNILNSFSIIHPTDVRDKAIVALLWDTGMRIGECLSLNVGDINLEKMEGEVRTFKRKHHRRVIMWTRETSNILARWLEYRNYILRENNSGCEALFISQNTATEPGRLDKCQVQRMLRETRTKLGMEKKITPHSFRHGYGYRANKSGMGIRSIQDLLGHAKITTTQIYTPLRREDLASDYRKHMDRSVAFAD